MLAYGDVNTDDLFERMMAITETSLANNPQQLLAFFKLNELSLAPTIEAS